MEISIQTRIDRALAAVDKVADDDDITSRLWLIVLECLIRELGVRADRLSEQLDGDPQR